MSENQQADAIRREMAAIRSDLHEDVHDLVETARQMSDWRYYVRRFPWMSVAAAAAVGFLVVPSRLEVTSPDPDSLAELARQKRLVVKPKAEAHPRRRRIAGRDPPGQRAACAARVAYVGRQAGRATVDDSP